MVLHVVVALDLDHFNEVVRKAAWPRYSPNPITGLLSRLVEDLVIKRRGIVIYGLDWDRGTEEAVIEFVEPDLEDLLLDLEDLRRRIEEAGKTSGTGVTLSIGVSKYEAPDGVKPVKDRRALKSSPYRYLALKALRKAKRLGGNRLVIV